jgi:acyl-CoA synthetase (AMP-forming)/AMP-acid ligase II
MTSGASDIGSLLAGAAARFPEHGGFEDAGRRWPYPELERRAAALARTLDARGVGTGEAVAWIGDNSALCGLAYFGAAWGGFVLAPLHLRLPDADLRRHVEHARARVVLCDAGSAARAASLGAEALVLSFDDPATGDPRPRATRSAGDPAHLYFTSGSTGVPKAVVLTHGNVTAHARLAAAALGLCAQDVWLHAAPMFHLADAWATFSATLVGATHRFVPRFRADAVLQAFAAGVTVTNLVPTMWDSLVREAGGARRRDPGLRLLLSGGAAISPDLVRRIRETFPAEYAQTYGLTETSPFLTINRLDAGERGLAEADVCRILARAGRPMPGVLVRVVATDGQDVVRDDATVGEVWARGPTVTPGYLRDPAADAAAFRDGWFRTGDLARVDASGRIDLVDRAKDVIHTGGEKVYSAEVERALAGLPGVLEVSVVATRDPHWGEVVTAVVVPEGEPPDLASVQAHARRLLAGFQVPRRLVVLRSLPRTASGKVAKREVRAAAEAATAAHSEGPEPRRGTGSAPTEEGR